MAVTTAERSPLLTTRRLPTDDEDDDPDIEQDAGDDDDAPNSAAPLLGPAFVPFPTQPDARKPLRPEHYRVRRGLEALRSFWRRNEGLLLIGIAQLFYSTMSLFFKLLHELPDRGGGASRQPAPRIGALQIILVRMGITWIGCVCAMLVTRTPHPFLGPPGVRRLLVLRGFVGYGGLFSLYYSLSYLSLADATVITFLAPLATGLLGYLLLGETFSAREALAGLTSVCGVLLIARPHFLFRSATPAGDVVEPPVGEEAVGAVVALLQSVAPQPTSTYLVAAPTQRLVARRVADGLALLVDGIARRDMEPIPHAANSTVPPPDASTEPGGVTEAQRIIAVGVALFGVLCAASAYTTVRAIGKRATPMHSVSYFALYSSLLSGLLMWGLGQPFVLPPSATWCVLLLCVGLFGLAAQILATMGLQRESAGRATSAVYTQVVWSTLFQLAVLHTPVHPWSAAGCAVILAAAIFVAVSK